VPLLMWQTVLVNPEINRRQDAADQSFTAVRGDIGALDDGSKSRNRDLAMTLSGIEEGQSELDT